MSTYRLQLTKFSGSAVYRSFDEGDDPIRSYVLVQIDADRFNAMGKPGYIDVTVAAAPAAEEKP